LAEENVDPGVNRVGERSRQRVGKFPGTDQFRIGHRPGLQEATLTQKADHTPSVVVATEGGDDRTHYARNLLSQVPKSAQPWVATLLRTVFEQPDTDAVQAQMRHVLEALEAKFPKAAAHLDAVQHDLLAFTAFPREIWRQIWSNNPQERLNTEIRRRTDVVGIFPDRTALIRLVGAVLAEQNDEWTENRR
jgi:transposase-like protein